MKWQLHHKSVAYAATTLGATMMNSVFGFFYVKIFLNGYKVSESWFQWSQVVYMLWNAINDPLFGYVQDNFNYSWVRSRRHSILYGAPLYGIAFLLPWFPWALPEHVLNGIHLMVSLCFFDALFTFVLLAQCALFAELSRRHEDRVRLVKYSQMASLLGSSSVFFCNYFSQNLHDFHAFQTTAVFIAIVGSLCIRYTGLHARTQYDDDSNSGSTKSGTAVSSSETVRDLGADSSMKSTPTDHTSPAEEPGVRQIINQTFQIVRDRDFLSFVLTNFCQVYHNAFLSGFAIIFCDHLISKDELSPFTRSLFYGSLSFTPQILVLLLMPAVQKIGYYRLVRASFLLKIMLGVSLWMMGPHPFFIMAFFLVDSAGVGGAFSLFNLSLSDIIDKDKELYKRKTPLSSMVFGTNALITKPAVSLAPMITVAILNHYGYSAIQAASTTDGAASMAATAAMAEDVKAAMVSLAVTTSVALGLVQLVIWSRYQLRNSHEVVSKYVEVDD